MCLYRAQKHIYKKWCSPLTKRAQIHAKFILDQKERLIITITGSSSNQFCYTQRTLRYKTWQICLYRVQKHIYKKWCSHLTKRAQIHAKFILDQKERIIITNTKRSSNYFYYALHNKGIKYGKFAFKECENIYTKNGGHTSLNARGSTQDLH